MVVCCWSTVSNTNYHCHCSDFVKDTSSTLYPARTACVYICVSGKVSEGSFKLRLPWLLTRSLDITVACTGSPCNCVYVLGVGGI